MEKEAMAAATSSKFESSDEVEDETLTFGSAVENTVWVLWDFFVTLEFL